MRIEVRSYREWCNFVNPMRWSVSTHITIFEGETTLMTCAIETEKEVWSNDPETVRRELEKWLSYTSSYISFSSRRPDVERVVKFLEKNAEELKRGNCQWELEELKKQRDELDKRIVGLEERLKKMGLKERNNG